MSQYTASIQALYVAYFNRPADPSGLAYWEPIVAAANGNTAAVSADFAKQPEYKAAYAGMTDDAVINQVYLNIFGRTVDKEGLNFWSPKLTAHLVTIDQIVTVIAKGAQGLDAETYENRTAASVAYTDALNADVNLRLAYSNAAAITSAKHFLNGITTDASLIVAIEPAALAANLAQMVIDAAPAGVTFGLTTGIDTFVGTAGIDTINAVPATGGFATFTSLDSIDGGAGNDVMNITATGTLTPGAAGAVVKNVETVNLATSADVNGSVASFAGLKTLNVSSVTGTNVTAAATTDVNEMASINNSFITGGKNVTIVHSTAGTVTSDKAAGSVNITSSNTGLVQVTGAKADVTVAAKGNIVAGGTSLTASALGATTLANVKAHIAASDDAVDAHDAALDADGAAAALNGDLAAMALAVAGATTDAAANAATLTAFANGDITAAQKLAIDAAFFTALHATSGTAAKAEAAALAVYTPIVNAAIAAKVITAGAVLTTAADVGTAATAVSADNSAATYIGVTDNVNTGLTKATVTGNFNGYVSIADSSTLGNTLTSVTLDHAGNANLTGNALTDITLSNSTRSVFVNNATIGHTENLTLSAVTASTISDGVAATLNVVSNGSSTNSVTLTAGSATAVNLSGAANLTVAAASAFAANAVINASAATGNVALSVAAGQAYTGGNGINTVTTGAAAQTAAVVAGSGTADILVITNAANSGATAAAKFSGFESLRVTGAVVDASAFTKSAFTSISSGGDSTINGLTAAQAAAVSVRASGSLDLGVTGALSIGQLDTVHITTSSTAYVNFGTGLALAGVETLNLTAGAAGTQIDSLTNATALTGVNIDGSGDVFVATGAVNVNVNTIIDAHAATGSITIDASDALANGLKIIGSATGDNQIWTNDLANVVVVGDGTNLVVSGAVADTITGGNGANTIYAGAGNNKVTLGNGINTVFSDGGADTIVVGNGYNNISTGAGNDKITVGTGANIVNAGTGSDTITFGAHVVGMIDQLVIGSATDSGSLVTATGSTAALDVVKGIQAGDTITFSGMSYATGNLSLTGSTLAGTDNAVVFATGTYDATAKTFVYSATGTDTLVTYDTDATASSVVDHSIVLVGFHAAATTTATAGIVTLA
jgi:hypothetical protein